MPLSYIRDCTFWYLNYFFSSRLFKFKKLSQFAPNEKRPSKSGRFGRKQGQILSF